ncbi:hypothetical protein DES41_110246 [Pseudorhodoferax soli]|uniref:Uncharacterized protein n=2 Tax=Pseudorhodoferax soli TaxID=545864 RepID=A0A368XFW1_9BURK|nr:hypothetical protein DES41_110246 [Pseudorhodoferax soli]
MLDDGEVVWGQVAMNAPRRFCILSIKLEDSICPELSFSDDDLYKRLRELEADEIVGISLIHPHDKAARWTAYGVVAVWLFEPENGETAQISYEFDTVGRSVWPEGEGAWSFLWRRS